MELSYCAPTGLVTATDTDHPRTPRRIRCSVLGHSIIIIVVIIICTGYSTDYCHQYEGISESIYSV